MRRRLTITTLLLALAATPFLLAQGTSIGGVFQPAIDYVVGGQWTWRHASPFVFEGATDNDFETTLTIADPTADRTITLPDATDTLVGKATTDTLSNKNWPVTTIAGDGAVTLASGIVLLTKGSAAAITVAAPGAAGIGTRITITTGTDFAHVVTFTGTTLQDGTAGANTTWTAAAVQGSSITFVGVTAVKWNVESFNLGTIAP